MARYKLVGLTRHITPVFVINDEGKTIQCRFKTGVTLEVDESQLTFHTHRLIDRKAIKLVEVEEKPVVPVKIKEKPVEVDTEELFITTGVNTFETTLEDPTPKKRRGRKKKVSIEEDNSEETEDMNMEEDEGVL